MGREIAIAVKEGGADPNNNSKLRDVIAKAKASNMPNDTIDRGIKKAAGSADSVNYEAVTYEGYGPSGTAIIVKALTDNKTVQQVMCEMPSQKEAEVLEHRAVYLICLTKKGQIIIDKEECEMEADDLMMIALDAGAEDFAEEEDSFEIITAPEDFSTVHEALEKEGIPMANAEVTMLPQTYVTLTDENDIRQLNRTLDLLDEDDDVQAVYHNWDE